MCSQLKCHTFYLVLQRGAQSVPEVAPGILPLSLLPKLVQGAPLPSWVDRGLALQRLQHSPSPARTEKSSGRPSLASLCEHCFSKGLMLYPERLALKISHFLCFVIKAILLQLEINTHSHVQDESGNML